MSAEKRFRRLSVLGFAPMKSESVKLVIGEIRVNPHLEIKCPDLRRGHHCYRRYRPHLLVKNHSNPRKQLWQCEGTKFCSPKPFLIRVQYEED